MPSALIIAVTIATVPAMVAAAPTPPIEHRLSAAAIAAAQADGETRNRAAELLATTRGDPALMLPGEKPKKWHGTAEVGIGSNGYREFGGEISTQFGGATATVAGDYARYDQGPYATPFRARRPDR